MATGRLTLASVVVRSRLPTRAVALAGLVVLSLAAPAAAQDDGNAIARKVLQDFSRDGRIDPCEHTSEELRLVLRHIPPDIEQYAPDYPSAVQQALEARARGECAGKQPQTIAPIDPGSGATPAGAGNTPQPTATAVPTKTVVPDPPEPDDGTQIAAADAEPSARADAAVERAAAAEASNDAPAAVVGLGILAGLLALAALYVVAARRFGWGEERLAGPRHAWREATWRAGGTWQDFTDWLRFGR